MADNESMKQWKIKNLDSKSASFCGAKWYNASIWLSQGWTTSCHHNPRHEIDLEAIKHNPRALHNTPIKKNERAMMQRGEKPANCQFCWVMEEVDPDGLADRTWLSWGGQITEQQLQTAFDNPADDDYDLTYLEIGFDRTCNLGCSYCSAPISSTWAKDIRMAGPYKDLATDLREHYTSAYDDVIKYTYGEHNPYAEAFFRWWDDSLHKTIKQIRITGGEPMMSGHTWRLLDWLADNAGKADCRIEMTTNLAYDYDTLMRFLDKCSRISVPVWVYTSGETIEHKMEYIRDGLDWELWNRNLDLLLSSKVIENTGICATMSAPAATGFVDFLYWLLDKKSHYGRNKNHTYALMVSVNPLRFPTFQNIVILPPELRLRYSQDINMFLENPLVQRYFLPIEIDHISRFAKYLSGVVDPHREIEVRHDGTNFEELLGHTSVPELQKDFRNFIRQYDQRRGKNFTQIFPELANWFNTIG